MRLEPAKYAYSVTFMCRLLAASRSGYYEWRGRAESATARRREELKTHIRDVFEGSDSTYDHRRIHAQLRRADVCAGVELVRHLMRELGLVPCQPRPRRFGLTTATAAPVPDLADRDFTALAPGRELAGDITYIPTAEGWLYLATVLDCYTKEVIGYAMAESFFATLKNA